MSTILDVIRLNQFAVGSALIACKEIVESGQDKAKADELTKLVGTVSRHYGILSGIVFVLHETLTKDKFDEIIKACGMDDEEVQSHLKGATLTKKEGPEFPGMFFPA